MATIVNCPCGMRVAANPELAGRVGFCPSCGRQLQVPAPLAAVPAWHGGLGGPRKKPNTALWIIAGIAVAVVLFALVVIGVAIGLTPTLDPVVRQPPDGVPPDAPSAVPGDGPASPRQRPNGVPPNRVPPSAVPPDAPSAVPGDGPASPRQRPGDVPPTPWTVVTDPAAPAPPFEAMPITVPKGESLERVRFSSPEAGQAVMHSEVIEDSEHSALSRIDLKSGRTLARALIGEYDELLAMSSDGALLLIKTHGGDGRQLNVYRWADDGIRPAGEFILDRLPGKLDACFLDDRNLLLSDSSNRIITKWSITTHRRQFAVDFRGLETLVVSPGGRYFVVREHYADTVSLYETATGRRAGVLRAPRRGQHRFVQFGFRRDGKVLATLVQENVNNKGCSLICWDMATGSLADYVPMTPWYEDMDDPLVWFDDRFVAAFDFIGANRISLVDLKYHDHVWRYSADPIRYTRSSDKIAADPAGRIWLERGSGFEGGREVPAAVVPIRLPRDAERQAIQQEYNRGPVLQPGDAVAFKMQFQTAPRDARKQFADRLSGALPELLRNKLAANDVRLEDGAPLQFQASVSYNPYASAPRNIRVWYDDASGLPNYNEIRVAVETVTIELSLVDADGEVLWRRAQIFTTGPVGPIQGIPNSQLQNDPETAAARGPWLEAERWVQELQLPRELHLQRGAPLGESKVP